MGIRQGTNGKRTSAESEPLSGSERGTKTVPTQGEYKGQGKQERYTISTKPPG